MSVAVLAVLFVVMAVTLRASTGAGLAAAGVATVPDNAVAPDRLVAAADAALYVAKDAGSNQVARSRRPADVGAAQVPSMRLAAMERSSA